MGWWRLGVWKRRRFWTFQTCVAQRRIPGTPLRCSTVFWELDRTTVGRRGLLLLNNITIIKLTCSVIVYRLRRCDRLRQSFGSMRRQRPIVWISEHRSKFQQQRQEETAEIQVTVARIFLDLKR